MAKVELRTPHAGERAPKACKNQGSCNINQIKTFRSYRSFEVVKKRWIVERSIAWITFQRRLNREYDLLPYITEAWVTLTFIRLMIRRVAQSPIQFESSQVAA